MKVLKTVGKFIVDFPLAVSVTLALLVVLHYVVSLSVPEVNVAAELAASTVSDPRDTLTSLSLGVAGVSAMVGGFAGVVVVFGLGSENDRFRLLRRAGGRRLRANWISVVLSSFTGAFGSVTSAIIVVAFGAEGGMWILEFCLLLTGHAALRLTALLAGLAGLVDSEDRDAERAERTTQSAALFAKRTTTRALREDDA